MTDICQRAFFRVDAAVRVACARLACAVACALLTQSASAAERALRLELGELRIAPIIARNVVLELAERAEAGGRLRIGALGFGERILRNVVLTCGVLSLSDGVIACRNGRLLGVPGGSGAQIALRYDTANSTGAIRLAFSASETLDARLGAAGAISLSLSRLRLNRLAAWLPQLANWQADGELDGSAWYAGKHVRANVVLSGGKFSDADGLHAGEALTIALNATGQRVGDAWAGDVQMRWPDGAVFWNPVLLSPEISLTASGRVDARQIKVESARVRAPGLDALTFNGRFDLDSGQWQEGALHTEGADLAVLVPQYVLPVVAPAQIERWQVAGSADAQLQWSAGSLESASLVLDGAGFSYLGQRFRVGPISGEVPWHRDRMTTARLHVDGLGWQKLDFSAFEVNARLSEDAVAFAPMRLPVLDGALIVDSLGFEKPENVWQAVKIGRAHV